MEEQRQASALVWLVLLLGPLPSLVQDGPVPLGLQASPQQQAWLVLLAWTLLLVWLVLRVSPEPVPVWREPLF